MVFAWEVVAGGERGRTGGDWYWERFTITLFMIFWKISFSVWTGFSQFTVWVCTSMVDGCSDVWGLEDLTVS